ncbi:Cyrochrome P450 monooxygenase [Lachnellula hyalina]|uniref:Cyrochrome P450 monooxygenase n=1 Tax=Lachnellula hyalina TaxID=1316788 RepID=A0A8H8R1I8_9HELO|nr:Cyrochrome P450 monooxygenase [Lachnellula hyalina]TVY25710.1 Cyrochrome P450 monooxygenase [Lachnellula hyalina]
MAVFPNLQMHWLIGVLVILGLAVVFVRRLYFSPLSKFPGPKLAAATILYEAYYDIIKQGQYIFKIKELHKKYGPIIRINPWELHINDPEYYGVLYSQTSPRNKYLFFASQFNIPDSVFSTIDHQHHRLRRQPLSPFFSKQSILRLEPTISSMVEKLSSRIAEFKRSGQPMPLRLSFACLSTDIVHLYAFNIYSNHLDSQDFSPKWNETIASVSKVTTFMKHFPWLYKVFQRLPQWITSAISPDMVLLLDWQDLLRRQVQRSIDEQNAKIKNTDGLSRNIFQSLLESDLPPEDKTVERLRQEAQLLLGAGSDTVANSLSITTFHLVDNPEKMSKLASELEKAMPDPNESARLTIVEQLPYLSAVIQEGLRLSYGVSARLQRIAPNEVLQFHEWSIPAGTPVGMSSSLMHHDESIFPDSYSFLPERWLDQSKSAPPLDRYVVAFSKGSRSCVGINLAKAELYLTIATVFRRYKVELFDTLRERDVDLKHDNFLPFPSHKSRGIRAIFK